MKYLIVQEWNNTKGNHAGMSHMCDLLVEKYPQEYVKITKDCPKALPERNWFMSRLMGWYDRMMWKNEWKKDYLRICKPMFDNLRPGDEVFLLEYNWPGTPQNGLAKFIHTYYPLVKIRSLSHITPTYYKRENAETFLTQWCNMVDTVMTMGHGLSEYFISVGVPKFKISTGFHYVDNEYYKVDVSHIKKKSRATIIAMGALQRDFQMLADIVNSVQEVDWIVCKGNKKIDHLFNKTENIHLIGFVPEDELRQLMSVSDISLNVFEDTVGSNVITTSLAMGLALIVSDVGSIRDYVDESNAVFCQNTKDAFIKAINQLISDPARVAEMRKASLDKVQNITIDKVHEWFNKL